MVVFSNSPVIEVKKVDTSKLPDHISEYLKGSVESPDFDNLFQADFSNFDLKSELNKQEIVLANIALLNSDFLKDKGFTDKNIFSNFINRYLRLRFSLDRKSRQEFVDINKRERFENNLSKFNSFQNLAKVKE